MWPIVSSDPDIQADYEMIRDKGTSHNLAKIFALRQCPSIQTGKQFVNSRPTHVNPSVHAERVAAAEAAGVSTTGKEYISQLARFPRDPEAWVRDPSDIKRVCEKNNWGCDGLVKVKAHETPPEPDIPIAKNIWDRRTQAILEKNPEMPIEAARERAFDEATGKVELNPIQRVTDHNFDM